MFTKSKFIQLSPEQQHKKCAELLRIYYEKEDESVANHYNEIQNWLSHEILNKRDKKSLSDRFHRHLTLAKQHLKEHNLLPKIKRGDQNEGSSPWPITIYLDHIRSSHNVGSIIRTCEALSLGTLSFSKDTPDTSHIQVKKTAMGCENWVEYKKYQEIHHLPKPLIALETATEAINLHEFIFPNSFTLAIGNEEYGLSNPILEIANFIISIPMRGRKNSLNVANAFAITAAEIVRQRGLS